MYVWTAAVAVAIVAGVWTATRHREPRPPPPQHVAGARWSGSGDARLPVVVALELTAGGTARSPVRRCPSGAACGRRDPPPTWGAPRHRSRRCRHGSRLNFAQNRPYAKLTGASSAPLGRGTCPARSSCCCGRSFGRGRDAWTTPGHDVPGAAAQVGSGPSDSGVTRLRACQRRPEVAGLRVDDDGRRVVALPRQGVARQLLERDLLRPTDVHDAVDRLAGR